MRSILHGYLVVINATVRDERSISARLVSVSTGHDCIMVIGEMIGVAAVPLHDPFHGVVTKHNARGQGLRIRRVCARRKALHDEVASMAGGICDSVISDVNV